MNTTDSTSDPPRQRVEQAFTDLEKPNTPLAVSEVAEKADCSKQVAQEILEEFSKSGYLETRIVVDQDRVWWASQNQPSNGWGGATDELSSFVRAVEDYAIFKLDPDGVVVNWNEGAERIKGYQESEIVGEHISTFYTAEDIESGIPEKNLETALAEGQVEDEGWRVRKDGTRFWANVIITAIRDEDGGLRGFTKVTRDSTEQREYEQQLREEREFSEQVLDTVPVSVFVVNTEGGLVRANQRVLDRLGVDEDEFEDRDIQSWDIYDENGDVIPFESWPWMRVSETGDPIYDFECQVDMPEIGRRWLSLNVVPLENEQADDGRVIFTVDDITERREQERQLRREYDQTRKLLRTAPIAIAVQDVEGNTVMANQRAQDALGLSEQELIEEPENADEWAVFDRNGNPLSPDETPSARVLATGEPVRNEEIAIEPPDRDRMQFRINAAPVYSEDGTIERVITTGEDITELKKREQELERRKTELETELSDILGRISDAFYALDDNWRFSHLNDHAAEIFQRPKEELLDQKIWDVFPDAAGVYEENFRKAMESQDPVLFEVHVSDLDVWLEFNVYPSDTGLSIYFRDISERKEREQKLTRYETIVETVNDGIYLKDGEGYFTMVNEAYADLTGYSIDELVGAHASLVVDEAAIEEANHHTGQRPEADESGPLEAELTTADGENVPAEGTFATLETDEGDTEQIGIVRDITERKQYERKIEESERRYRTLVENFPNGAVALFDEDLRYTAVGGQLLEGEGIHSEERVGKHIVDLYPEEIVTTAKPYFEGALRGESSSFEVNYLGRDLSNQVLPVLNADDEVYAGMLVAQDITEQKEYERKLETSNERLEQFAYAASHDLQEPLRMVSSYIQMIEDRYADDLDEDGQEFIDFAVDGADRMRNMIDGLLKYSRVGTHGEPFEPVDLDDVLEDVRDDLQVRIEESDATVESESLPEVTGDPGQLRQVFQNLIDNAIEYSGEEPPFVDISVEREGTFWTVSVQDEGIGIEPEDADRAFEVFQSLQPSTEHPGTGIGLAICERIIERHGGDIWVESQPDEGATFVFTLLVGDEDGE